ncbi:hypothetical protein AUJ14_03610 [Candidatus Micrarchaeota archaeon CG1_02_55_22]|nr:MAG: hypothetical protein AUJ14_03610 [Candidatus Micrarchaeota archaeon CG1_02_55_22]
MVIKLNRRPEVLRAKTPTLGEVTIPEAYTQHINVGHLRQLVEQATAEGKGHLIPAGELPIGVVTRVHNTKTVEDLVELIRAHPKTSRQSGWLT